MKFDRAYLLFINLAARLFGAMALVVGIVFLVSALRRQNSTMVL